MSEQMGGGAPSFQPAPPVTPAAPAAPAMRRAYDAPGQAPRRAVQSAPPLLLRPTRLLAGVFLLVISLGGILLELILATNLRDAFNHATPTSLHLIVLALLDAFAGLWVLVVILGCLFTGVMSLAFAVSRRGW